jgi:DNA polymerase III subunit gamma/tau
MENFVVSARKYRPATFDTVVGQSHITTTLRNAIRTGQLAQAFLFCGPRGVGKTTCARILAKTINCLHLTPEGEACNTCDSCVAFNRNASFNVHELDAASNNSVDDVRDLVEQVRYPPQAGKYKVYIIDEVHMLSNAAFNAFLKTLEEPPGYAIFILATTEKHKILPTILSRCQIFDFNRIQISDIAGQLADIAHKENITAETEALQLIARKADGGMRDALSMFDMLVTFSRDRTLTYRNAVDNLHVLDYEYYFKIADALLEQNAGAGMVILDEILRKGFDGHNFISGLTEHFRNLMVCRDAQTVPLLEVSEAVRQKYAMQAKQAGLSFIISAMNLGSQCELSYKQSKNPRLLVELALVKMAHLPSVIHLHQNGNGEEVIKKKPEPVAPIMAVQESNGEYGKVNGIPSNGSPVEAEVKNAIPQKKTFAFTNLEEVEKQLAQPAKATEGEAIAENQVAENQGFTEEQVKKLLTELAVNLEQKNRLQDAVIVRKPFTLIGTTIELTLDSETQIALFSKDFKPQLTNWLRKQLSNDAIQLQAIVGEVEEVKRGPYTVEEKWKHLLRKHPLLASLKNELNLELM